MPVVPARFDRGPAEPPECLLTGGCLAATHEPREVKLAEAYCTEGCCGALYVTVVREGDEVVWKRGRASMHAEPLPEDRFDAAEYDRQIARAEQDHSWEWPARTLARLLTERLRADPTILARWDCRPGWCTSWLKDFDTARMTFTHPAGAEPLKEPHLWFGLVIDVQEQAPESVAEQVLESLRTVDPKTVAEMIGGTKDGAEKLGLVYRKPVRW
jgi:hypothetical protein